MSPGTKACNQTVALLPLRRSACLPDSLEFSQTAAFPCPGLTAWQALEKLPMSAGAEVLIAGAGGTMGRYLVQLAVARGQRVTVMCSERHWARLTALGAEYCLATGKTVDRALLQHYFALIYCVGTDHALALKQRTGFLGFACSLCALAGVLSGQRMIF
ncbi:hypothetical protein LU631_06010 [Erwinia tracheiphila]|nr:hypothetical protein [Erwinia tracheiphila]UIA88876.1 hypothetical protein LU631_06010 [Erwinia tracheiphila]UIA97257.1 hypothetical protein LU633_04680 [Erwinia tracheiphila]